MRSEQIAASAFWVGLVSIVTAGAFGAEQSARPDILFIMPDQMRGDCLSILEHPVVRTPTVDRLAEQGVLFRRAYTPVASCIPARYALLTGLYPQTSGVVGYKKRPIEFPTMPRVLRAAGYRTALIGRNMHQIVGAAELGYETDTLGDAYTFYDEQYPLDVRKAAPEVTNFREWVEGTLGLSYNHWQATPWPLSNDLHPTTWVVTHSRQVVSAVPEDQPLFLTASFVPPHPPLYPPKKYYDGYLRKELPAAAHGDWVDWDSLTPEGKDGGHRVLLQGETLRKAQAGYFGLIEHLDHEIAPLIAEFKARSERAGRPWVIVFTADHGEMLGDHGYFRKCEPFEGSANIPFVISGSPELGFEAGRTCMQPVTLEDIFPTLAELGGVDCPDVDGVSLVPELRGQSIEIRPWLHFEHAPCYSKAQAFHALTDGRYKYVWRPLDGREHLFDLRNDPREEHDLSSDPTHRQRFEKWHNRMVRRLAERPEGFSDGQDLIAGRPYEPLNAGTR